ncbi:MAG: pyruvate dehydrogenase complex dihydrolipoamide acetyltransferase, partial [Chitinophagaceae bacterium]
ATMELESYKDGTLLYIGVDQGGRLQVDDLLAIVGKPGEDITTLLKSGGQKKETENQQPKKESSKQESVSPAQHAAMDVSKSDEVVLMPRLSDTMEEGVIASWKKNVGDMVKKGDVLAEIETDKATMELESYKNGTLLYIGAKQGEKIPVNALLCIIGEKTKVDVDAIVAAVKQQPVMQISGSDVTKPVEKQKSSQETAVSKTQATAEVTSGNGRVKASPLAKKIAREKGVDLKSLQGSGDGGRIIKADIDTYNIEATSEQTTVTSPIKSVVVPAFAAGVEGYTDIPNSQVRNIIAKRLGESKFSAPHFYLTMEINMDNAMSARTQLNEVSPVKISFNDMVVKAAGISLRHHPAINASWLPALAGTDGGDKIRRYQHIHIGIAVAIEDGLIVPVIRFADQKTLPQIAAESKLLSGKAKNKKLQPDEFTGNTFTVSNLGMMDIDEFTAIINPPDSCIMAVGKIKEVVVRKSDGFGVTHVMKITLSCDHRCVDGATGAAFLQTFKKYMENPVMMLV